MTFQLPGFDLDDFISRTLAEDAGDAGDVTSAAVIPADARLNAVMDSRDAIVVCGLPIAAAFFRRLDPDCEVGILQAEGAVVSKGADLMRVSGNARALLTAERPALNTVQHLSGIATVARQYADAVAGTGATVLDTRKSHPGLRRLQKYAAKTGGVTNHRMTLSDQPMIKDNHVAIAGSVAEAVRRAKDAKLTGVVVEVDRLDQIEPALAAGADRLLLDNMGPETLRQALAIVNGRVPTEASGGVNLETIRAIAETGVDFISVGRIIQSSPAADIGLDFAGD
ncbi:carboxylating nicotinate-nucleotide diphosphorylase [Pacificimonas sp. WHA3]|uniref:Quinolinate phosphoribosyltransferase [decarboxylating] n=1 Tax=Pacificimonas pallii TaxID=2827236 RepID=A0ABS6SDE7_9SPHN|nr:carboxylating nicotinate-nucleotide diphosphorylase [Pacificimonas pallii]MBV7255931.1 carboxylating nicotinate-nucleotide diphosphorylase [Pacificimonas pallii]